MLHILVSATKVEFIFKCNYRQHLLEELCPSHLLFDPHHSANQSTTRYPATHTHTHTQKKKGRVKSLGEELDQ